MSDGADLSLPIELTIDVQNTSPHILSQALVPSMSEEGTLEILTSHLSYSDPDSALVTVIVDPGTGYTVEPDGRTWAAVRITPTQEWFVTNTFSF